METKTNKPVEKTITLSILEEQPGGRYVKTPLDCLLVEQEIHESDADLALRVVLDYTHNNAWSCGIEPAPDFRGWGHVFKHTMEHPVLVEAAVDAAQTELLVVDVPEGSTDE